MKFFSLVCLAVAAVARPVSQTTVDFGNGVTFYGTGAGTGFVHLSGDGVTGSWGGSGTGVGGFTTGENVNIDIPSINVNLPADFKMPSIGDFFSFLPSMSDVTNAISSWMPSMPSFSMPSLDSLTSAFSSWKLPSLSDLVGRSEREAEGRG